MYLTLTLHSRIVATSKRNFSGDSKRLNANHADIRSTKMKGMVVCPQPHAAEVGIRILRRGGNAVDAAVAAALVQGVIDPTNCGIGGFGQMNVFIAGKGEEKVIDFHARAGAKVKPEMWEGLITEQPRDRWGYVLKGEVNARGYTSIAVPGTVMGLSEGLARFGTIPWRDAVEPAIDVAAHGYTVAREDAIDWRTDPQTFAPLLAYLEARKIYTKEGEPYSAGDVIVNKDYAETLRRLAAEGAEAFYKGDLSSLIADDMERNGAFVTAGDLSRYKVREYTPLVSEYRGYTVASNDAPGGGISLLEILNILEGYDLSKYDWRGMGSDVGPYALILAEAMRAAEKDRIELIGDPEFVSVPTKSLISKERAAQWKGRIDAGEKIVLPRWRPGEHPTTTHISVVDPRGNAVSLTHTLGSCSGVITPGLGFMYNNAMINFDPVPGGPNSIAPGKSRNTQMAPTIVYDHGDPYLVVGAPGGSKILTAVSQTIVNIIDHGMVPSEAVAHPRIFALDTDIIDISNRVPSSVEDFLKSKGNKVVRLPASYDDFAMTQAITSRRDKGHEVVLGGSDPRRKGAVMST
jgi:gamma-glutamyltranspeptidase / glutathione hydrolase